MNMCSHLFLKLMFIDFKISQENETKRVCSISLIYCRSNMFGPKWPSSGIIKIYLKDLKTNIC